jgi:hypothetical protein
MLFKNILLHIQGLNCEDSVYELKDVRQEALSSNLLLKVGSIKKIPLVSFPNHFLKNVGSSFPYAH